MNRYKISVVIPCYYAEKSIAGVVEKTAEELDKYCDYEFVLVNDGSDDGTYSEIRELAARFPFVIGVDLAKNCGQHNAILAGMKYASGDYILGMDDDFQTHPSQIRKLLDKPKDLKACPMYIIRRFVRDEIIKSESSFSNLQGLFLRTTLKIANVDIEHFDRRFGKSGYTFKKLIRLWASLLNYSLKPVRLILKSGTVIFAVSLICLIAACIFGGAEQKIYAEIGVFSGLILSAIGVVGEYVIRMFMAVTKEPQYIIRQDTLSGDVLYEKEVAGAGRR